MPLKPLRQYIQGIKEWNYLLEQVLKDQDSMIYGVAGSQKSLLASLIFEAQPQSVLYIVENPQRGKEIFDDLNNLLQGYPVHYFPALDILPFEVIAQSHETQHKRLEVLRHLLFGRKNIVVTTLEAISHILIDPEVLCGAVVSLQTGERKPSTELLRKLTAIGYQRVDRVEEKGQFALRGGILDVYSTTEGYPYRVEFFDEEIDSLRLFKTEDQRSLQTVGEALIFPATEFPLFYQNREKALRQIQEEAQQLLKAFEKKGSRESYQATADKAAEVLESIREEQFFAGYEQYLPYFFPERYTLLDYFPGPPLVILDEPNRQRESLALREKETLETYKVLLEKGKILPGQYHNYLTGQELCDKLAKTKKVYYSLLPKKPSGVDRLNIVGVTAKTPSLYMGKTKLLVDELKEWRRQKYAVIILVNSEERGQRLRQGLWDLGVEAVVTGDEYLVQPEQVYITTGYLTGGLELTTWKVAVLTEHEVFHQPKKKAPRKIFQEGKRISALEDLKVGDYVVHINHGVGRYIGIEKLTVGDSERDYLLIKYQGEDKLYVPTDQSHLLQKYSYQEGQSPKLSRLGGNEWNKIKARVKTAVRDMAEELLALYAVRQSQPGYAFAPDTPWQREFEEAFPFEETADQLQAIQEVKRDMEKPQPMDRLLCGDVGYGKTEVAIRAAFKAVSDNKQVAVLVPTTVLAQQHYATFRERFEGFAVKVDVLSRFRSPKEQKNTLKELSQGRIDVLIGTHRLLSKDVKFKDLGLLVVDEEQRFGVLHKEKIKKLKKTVDVLTLTATPIPRTLHMSLVGVRDMSIIETPPEDRYPVQTFVVEHSEQMVREAIRRELGRGGQVYYVHNRVEDIDRTAGFLQELVPEARLGIAHGQMTEDQLENVMLDFMEGRLDLLVCTTIIESGLDISNVNTLIIDEADKLGLSQLYQLRGRVGRSNRVAYAYLTYNKNKILSEVAEKRLSAIREFTELGSGFKIAMRDLEIRGSGNILGAEQHGHVAAVGFDLYCRMLEEAVKEVKGEETPVEKIITIDIQAKAYIPQEYVGDTGIKIDFYQRINMVKHIREIEQLREEFRDRFGELPEPVSNLLKISSIKTAAAQAKILAITQEKEMVRIKMEEDHGLNGSQLMQLARRYRRQVSFSASAGLDILVNIRNLEPQQMLDFLEEIIREISALADKQPVLI